MKGPRYTGEDLEEGDQGLHLAQFLAYISLSSESLSPPHPIPYLSLLEH